MAICSKVRRTSFTQQFKKSFLISWSVTLTVSILLQKNLLQEKKKYNFAPHYTKHFKENFIRDIFIGFTHFFLIGQRLWLIIFLLKTIRRHWSRYSTSSNILSFQFQNVLFIVLKTSEFIMIISGLLLQAEKTYYQLKLNEYSSICRSFHTSD